MITVDPVGKELHYSVNMSLINGFNTLLKSFLVDDIKSMIELLSGNLDNTEDVKVKNSFHALINEYKKLYLAIHVVSQMIDEIKSAGTLIVDIENLDVEEVARKISIRYGITEVTKSGK